MKKLTCAIMTVLMTGSVLAACSEEKEETTVVEQRSEQDEQMDNGMSAEDQEAIARLEKGILLYGEGVKGGTYGITMNRAYADDATSVRAKVTVKNVRADGEAVDLSELRYELHDVAGNKTYEGNMVSSNNGFLPATESMTYDISFNVPLIADDYQLYVISEIDPFDLYWEIKDLTQSENH